MQTDSEPTTSEPELPKVTAMHDTTGHDTATNSHLSISATTETRQQPRRDCLRSAPGGHPWPQHCWAGLERLARFVDQDARGRQTAWIASAILDLEERYSLSPDRVA